MNCLKVTINQGRNLGAFYFFFTGYSFIYFLSCLFLNHAPSNTKNLNKDNTNFWMNSLELIVHYSRQKLVNSVNRIWLNTQDRINSNLQLKPTMLYVRKKIHSTNFPTINYNKNNISLNDNDKSEYLELTNSMKFKKLFPLSYQNGFIKYSQQICQDKPLGTSLSHYYNCQTKINWSWILTRHTEVI